MTHNEEEGLGYTAGGELVFKPIRDFIQFDGFAGAQGDCYSDEDGDGMFSGLTREPQLSGTTVRILVAADANHDDVVRILRKYLECIKRNGLSHWTKETDSECPF